MSEWQRPSWVEIDHQALSKNATWLRSLVNKDSFYCPMIKANAYGHGAVAVAKTMRAQGVQALGVALLEEAIELRENKIDGSILVFSTFAEASIRQIIQYQITPVLVNWAQLRAFARELQKDSSVQGAYPIHLKFNTGMNRLGFAVSEAREVREFIVGNPQLQLEGVATHLAQGDDAGVADGYSAMQMKMFSQVLASFQGLRFQAHGLNSSGLVSLAFAQNKVLGPQQKEFAKDWVWPQGARPGLALYGLKPASQIHQVTELHPVLSWKSRVMQLQTVETGARVSYNGIWQAKQKSKIGVIPLGYADGFSRLLSNRHTVLCRGERVPIVGIVCMDYFMVDLTALENKTGEVRHGEEIVLLGRQGQAEISADELAEKMGTISYEVVTSITERVPRKHV